MIQTYILNHLILKQFHHQNILNKIILRINQINFKTINSKIFKTFNTKTTLHS